MPRKPKAGVAAEVTLTLRMTDGDRALLDRLVRMRAEELAEMGADEVDVTAASYVRGLIRREAKAKGLSGAAPVPSETGASMPVTAPPGVTAEPDATTIHGMLVRALEKGAVASQLAKSAGIDRSALSKFKSTGRGISAEKLRALERALS